MSIKYIIIGIVVLVITTAIGGTIYAAKSYVDGLNTQITDQLKEITALKVDKTKLETSNKSLDAALAKKVQEAKNIQEEIITLRKVDAESQARMIEITRKLRSEEDRQRREKLRNKKAGLILRKMDAQAKCWVENFDRKGGKCIVGKWLEDKVPVVPNGGSGNDASNEETTN